MTRKLTISILPDGTITADASGTPGPDCLSAIEQLRYMLGAEVSDSKPTPEFSASPAYLHVSSSQVQPLEDHA